jgi:hypothetical protein
MDPLFLTPEQLQELTGYVQPAAQIRWLRKSGIQHYIRADGHPVVPLAALNPREPPAKARVGPDLDAIRTTRAPSKPR